MAPNNSEGDHSGAGASWSDLDISCLGEGAHEAADSLLVGRLQVPFSHHISLWQARDPKLLSQCQAARFEILGHRYHLAIFEVHSVSECFRLHC